MEDLKGKPRAHAGKYYPREVTDHSGQYYLTPETFIIEISVSSTASTRTYHHSAAMSNYNTHLLSVTVISKLARQRKPHVHRPSTKLLSSNGSTRLR